jgi:hypothetical protein
MSLSIHPMAIHHTSQLVTMDSNFNIRPLKTYKEVEDLYYNLRRLVVRSPHRAECFRALKASNLNLLMPIPLTYEKVCYIKIILTGGVFDRPCRGNLNKRLNRVGQ